MDKAFKTGFEKQARRSTPFAEQMNNVLDQAKSKIKKAVKKSTRKKRK